MAVKLRKMGYSQPSPRMYPETKIRSLRTMTSGNESDIAEHHQLLGRFTVRDNMPSCKPGQIFGLYSAIAGIAQT